MNFASLLPNYFLFCFLPSSVWPKMLNGSKKGGFCSNQTFYWLTETHIVTSRTSILEQYLGQTLSLFNFRASVWKWCVVLNQQKKRGKEQPGTCILKLGSWHLYWFKVHIPNGFQVLLPFLCTYGFCSLEEQYSLYVFHLRFPHIISGFLKI